MKALIDSDLMIEILLNRTGNKLCESSRKLWEVIKITHQSQEINFYITRPCVERVYTLSSMNSSEDADILISLLESIFHICEGSTTIFQNARQYDSGIESAIEVECGLAIPVDAIITQFPQKYAFTKHNLYLWSVENFITRYQLDLNYLLELEHNNYKPKYEQLTLSLSLEFLVDKPSFSTYMVRNSITTVIEALKIIQTSGYKGITKKELKQKLERSDTTINNIIWDLENFDMIFINHQKKILAARELIGKGEDDISQYLSFALKKHILIQEIYKELEIYKSITPWRLQEIIANVCPSGKQHKDKTLIDYRSRVISWLIFARLLEKRRNNTLTRPREKSSRTISSSGEYQQLNLPLNGI
jgi:hypothetical protein